MGLSREAGSGYYRCLRRIILPVVIPDQERSITVAQLQRWIGQRIRCEKAVRLGPMPRTIILSAPLLPPRMNPAITMLLPVPIKARVLILASFEPAA